MVGENRRGRAATSECGPCGRRSMRRGLRGRSRRGCLCFPAPLVEGLAGEAEVCGGLGEVSLVVAVMAVMVRMLGWCGRSTPVTPVYCKTRGGTVTYLTTFVRCGRAADCTSAACRSVRPAPLTCGTIPSYPLVANVVAAVVAVHGVFFGRALIIF